MARTQVQAELIATNAISGTIIADNAITATHIATNSISGTLVQNGGIVTTMIAANNVTSTKIVTDAIQTRHIADDQVTGDKLTNNISIAGTLASGGDLTVQADGAEIFLKSADHTVARIIPRGTGGDLDKGLLSLFDTGTEDVRIDTAGNSWFNGGSVGIGTTSPSHLLHVTGSVAGGYAAKVENTNSTNGFGLIAKTAHTGTSAFAFGAYAASNPLMVVRSDGNIGIGTDSPNAYSGYTTLTLNHATTGGIIDFEVDGTLTGEIYSNNTGIGIQTVQADDDIIFKGNDGGSTITALTLDMSAAGKGIFNAGATFANRVEFNYDGDYQLKIDNGSSQPWYQRVQSDGTFALHLNGTGNIFHATSSGIGVTGDIDVTSTDAGSSAGPVINLVRDSSSPADADYLGQIKFKGDDDNGGGTTYSKITGKIGDASNGSEDGIIEFAAQKAGSSTILARLSSTKLALLNSTELEAPVVDGENFKINGAQGSDGQVLTSTGSGVAWETPSSFNADAAQTFNESGAAVDFRIEGDTEQNLFFVDGSANKIGIGTNSPSQKLEVVGPGTSNGVTLNLSDAASSANSKHLLLTRGASTTASIGVAGSQANDPLWISRSGGYDLMVASSGNVGINSQATNARLEVVATSGEVFRADANNGAFRLVINQSDVQASVMRTTAGALSAPSYSFIGDTSTGMSRPTSSAVNFVCGGTEKARVDTNGLKITHTSHTGENNGQPDVVKTSFGGIHFESGSSGTSRGITWEASDGNTQAGIVCHNNGSDGTHLGFFTTYTYAGGPICNMKLTNYGTVVAGASTDVMSVSPASTTAFHSNYGDILCNATNNDILLSDLLPGYSRNSYATIKATGSYMYFSVNGAYSHYLASSGGLTASDARLKENVSTLTNSLSKVKQLRGVNFTWKDTETRGSENNIGFIAQEVETIYPELVGDGGLPKDDNGEDAMKAVNYEKLVPVLVEAIKELEARIATLEG